MRARRKLSIREALGTLLLAAVMIAAGVFVACPADADEGFSTRLRSEKQRGANDERLKTTAMWSLHWHDDWKDPVLLNRIERRKPTPIFHLRILGDLTAKT